MARATAEQMAAMDKAVAEVRAQYGRARVRVEANTSGWFVPEEAKSVAKAFADVGVLLERWATRYYNWALVGVRDDGTTYGAERFLAFGQGDVADAVERISGEAYDRSFFAAVSYAAAETGATLASPSAWPPWLKWGAAAVGGVVVLAVVVAVARR